MKIGLPSGRLKSDSYFRESFVFEHERSLVSKCGPAFIFKARVIPQLLQLGIIDVGVCGHDLVEEAEVNLHRIRDLPGKDVRIVAATKLNEWPKRPLLIATEYPRIAEKWAYSKNLSHTILMTYGSTEAFAGGIADIIVDCVDTGQTLKANGIQIVDTIMHSSPGVYCRKECSDKWSNLINSLL